MVERARESRAHLYSRPVGASLRTQAQASRTKADAGIQISHTVEVATMKAVREGLHTRAAALPERAPYSRGTGGRAFPPRGPLADPRHPHPRTTCWISDVFLPSRVGVPYLPKLPTLLFYFSDKLSPVMPTLRFLSAFSHERSVFLLVLLLLRTTWCRGAKPTCCNFLNI